MFFKQQNELRLPIDLMLGGGDHGFLGVFLRGAQLFSFDKYDSLLYVRESIDGYPVAKFEVSQSSAEGGKQITLIRPSKEIPLAALDISVSGSHIYALAMAVSKKKGVEVTDVYSVENGSYLYSFEFQKLPGTDGLTSFSFSKGVLCTAEILTDGRAVVRKYRVQLPE